MNDKLRKKTVPGGNALSDRWMAIVVVVAFSAISFALGYFLGGTSTREAINSAPQKLEPVAMAPRMQVVAEPAPEPAAAPKPGNEFAAMPPDSVTTAPSLKPKAQTNTPAAPALKPAADATLKPVQSTVTLKPAEASKPAPKAAEPAKTSSSKVADIAKKASAGSYTVQVGAFKGQAEADALKKKLASSGHGAAVFKSSSKTDTAPYKVRMGSYKERKEADAAYAKVSRELGLKGFVTKAD